MTSQKRSRRPSLRQDHPAEYSVLQSAISRCHNPKHVSYANYGGRGIKVCSEWRNDFEAFLEHVGPKPSRELILGRTDVRGDYEPGNVRWCSRSEQQNNRLPYAHPSTLRYEVQGDKLTPIGIARKYGFSPSLIYSRISQGDRGEELIRPIGPQGPKGR